MSKTNLNHPIFIDKQIGRLQISMDHSRMTCMQIVHASDLQINEDPLRFKET